MRTNHQFGWMQIAVSLTPGVLPAMIVFASFVTAGGNAGADTIASDASPKEVKHWFDQQDKTVVTFMGYSGAGYEDSKAMLAEAKKILSSHEPDKTIVNIGATSSGIGAVYEVAKKMGFTTTGVVSTQAKKYEGGISPFVDRVFFVPDETWGGLLENTNVLAPTSHAMVESSDVVVCFGGGEVSRDEMAAAKKLGKTVKYFPADMDHQKAIEKARTKGLPVPTDFKGAAHATFGKAASAHEEEK